MYVFPLPFPHATLAEAFCADAVRSTDAPWQMSAVEGYLNQSTVVFPPGEYYNATNRGYPDVSVVSTTHSGALMNSTA